MAYDKITCQTCNQTLELEWRPTDKGPTLFNRDGTPHQIKSDTRVMVKGQFKYVVDRCTGQTEPNKASQAISISPIAATSDIDDLRAEISKTQQMALGVTLQVANMESHNNTFKNETESIQAQFMGNINRKIGTLEQDFSLLDKKWTDIAESKREVAIQVADRPQITLTKHHKMLEKATRLLAAGLSVYMRGGAGGGKTSACAEMARILHIPFYPMSIGPTTSEGKVYGFISQIDGKYYPSQARKAWEFGGLLMADEIDAGLAGTNTYFHPFAETGTKLISFPDAVVERHPDFRFVATANTYGLGADAIYVGRNQQDGAFLDRFTVINWDYDWDFVSELAQDYDWTMRVKELSLAASKVGARVVIGPRAAIEGAVMIANGFSWEEAEESKIWAKISPEDKNKILGVK